MSEPHGPIKIGANRQIALPKALMDRVRLDPGDQVYVLADDRDPGVLVVVPVERVTEWLRLGREAEEREQIDGRERATPDE
jgi:bifunctional DNA-binding transcriptional regulator/antitoxin component of YhaV-PrlF toxin-antitoxin module